MSTVNQLAKVLKVLSANGYGDRRLDCYNYMAVVLGPDVAEDSALGKKLIKAGAFLLSNVGWCVTL